MSDDPHEHLEDLRSAAAGVVSNHLASDSEPNPALDRQLWEKLAGLGFIGLAAEESVGGSGGNILDAATVLGELRNARVPYAEAALIAAPALSAMGVTLPSTPYTAGQAAVTGTGDRLNGLAQRVPFARDCETLILLASGDRPTLHVVALDAPGVSRSLGENLAGEPRDTVTLTDVQSVVSAELTRSDQASWLLRAAAARAVASAGIASAVLERTARYVTERVQFGRPLVKFQAIQHSFARMAADATAMQVASVAATMALLDDPISAEPMVAVAKGETASLAGQVAAAAHQIHGAIGITREYGLGALTTRLWAWREEYGNERFWHQRLGEIASGRDLWSLVTAQQ